MKLKRFFTLLLAGTMAVSMTVPAFAAELTADSSTYTEDSEDYAEDLSILAQMIEKYPAEEKTITIGEDDVEEELSVSVNTLSSEEDLLEEYGYTETDEENVYETEYEYSRILVDGEVADEDAALSCTTDGITVLQYETPEEAALAANEIEDDGYLVVADTGLDITFDSTTSSSSSTTENIRMNLSENATGKNKVRVAVIDTGVTKSALSSYSSRLNTGYNIQTGGSTTKDNYNHGTAVASVILRNCGKNVSVTPIKMYGNDNQQVSYTQLINAFTYAQNDNCHIINCSWAIETYSTTEMKELKSIIGAKISACINAGCTVVAAAGNEGLNCENSFPANYSPCWTVAALYSNDELADWSNCGETVDFDAPGVDITVTNNKGKTTTMSGTSFSAPLVSCIAAQLAAQGYSTNAARLKYTKKIAVDLGAEGWDDVYGYGLPVMDTVSYKGTLKKVSQNSSSSNSSSKKKISKIALKGKSLAKVTTLLSKAKGNGDTKDSNFRTMKAKATNVKKTSVRMTWNKVKKAKYYVVYYAREGSSSYQYLGEVSGTNATVTQLSKGTSYKFLIVAFNKNSKCVQTAKSIHITTKGGKSSTAKKVVVKRKGKSVKSVTVKKGKTISVKAIAKGQKGKTYRKIRLESSNKKLATVKNGKLKIKGKAKGTCYIYAYAQSGKYKKIKVTVK